MTLQKLFEEYKRLNQSSTATDDEIEKLWQTIRNTYNRITTRERENWILNHLSIEETSLDKNYFFANVLKNTQKLPDSVFEPILKAAVYETDPSFNQYFIEPAVKVFGFKRVAERLLRYLNEGSNFEKAGAINAFYWILGSFESKGEIFKKLRQQIRDKFLTEFVYNEDTEVRRSIICSLVIKKSCYSPNVRNLLKIAKKIARNHPDEFIRHRYQIQLG